jgi:hypothetical protein
MEESFVFNVSSFTLQLTNVFGTYNCTEPINNKESWEFNRVEEERETVIFGELGVAIVNKIEDILARVAFFASITRNVTSYTVPTALEEEGMIVALKELEEETETTQAFDDGEGAENSTQLHSLNKPAWGDDEGTTSGS